MVIFFLMCCDKERKDFSCCVCNYQLRFSAFCLMFSGNPQLSWTHSSTAETKISLWYIAYSIRARVLSLLISCLLPGSRGAIEQFLCKHHFH